MFKFVYIASEFSVFFDVYTRHVFNNLNRHMLMTFTYCSTVKILIWPNNNRTLKFTPVLGCPSQNNSLQSADRALFPEPLRTICPARSLDI